MKLKIELISYHLMFMSYTHTHAHTHTICGHCRVVRANTHTHTFGVTIEFQHFPTRFLSDSRTKDNSPVRKSCPSPSSSSIMMLAFGKRFVLLLLLLKMLSMWVWVCGCVCVSAWLAGCSPHPSLIFYALCCVACFARAFKFLETFSTVCVEIGSGFAYNSEEI